LRMDGSGQWEQARPLGISEGAYLPPSGVGPLKGERYEKKSRTESRLGKF